MLLAGAASSQSRGMEIGLSICRSIIDGHGGRLWAASAPSHGALVQFTLPNDPIKSR
jgi:signal transduction histidine kinase